MAGWVMGEGKTDPPPDPSGHVSSPLLVTPSMTCLLYTSHSQHIWNILGLYVVGFAAVLAGGCPLRQLVLAGQGSSDSAVTFLGLLVGAAFCHNFGLAASAAAAATADTPAVPGGLAMACLLYTS